MLKTFSRIELVSENNLFKLCVCWMKGMWTKGDIEDVRSVLLISWKVYHSEGDTDEVVGMLNVLQKSFFLRRL